MMCGGTSDVKEANEEIHELVKEIRGELEKKVEKTYPDFKAVSFKSQVVAGTNFFVKILVNDGEYVHVRIFRPLPHTNEGPKVHSYQENKTKDDALEYF
ncbi:cystatin-B-like [Physella acuta]|uniref:cystatin-B-like n=1 Tax=Physella acuta TaxID=109671 RepID=UPI0027DD221E|nr:cystatin-B-like [Physella acuta]